MSANDDIKGSSGASERPWHATDCRHQRGGQIRIFSPRNHVANVLASGASPDADADLIVRAVNSYVERGSQELVVVLHEREADALLALLEQALNAGMDPGIGLQREHAYDAGVKVELARAGVAP